MPKKIEPLTITAEQSGEQQPIRLVLPYPPSANRYWRHVVVKKRAMIYPSEEAKAYKRICRVRPPASVPHRRPRALHSGAL